MSSCLGVHLLKPSLYQAGNPCLVSGIVSQTACVTADVHADREAADGPAAWEQMRAEAEAVVAAAEGRAAEIIAAAEGRAAEIAADAARQAQEQALRELQDEVAGTRRRAAAEADEVVAAARAQSQMSLAAVERETIVLALEIARKIVASELQVSPEVVLAVAGEALGRIPHGVAGAALRVSPDDLQRALAGRERLKNISGDLRELEVIPHPQVARGGCIVETPAGDVDARMETRFAKLEQALLPGADDGEGGA